MNALKFTLSGNMACFRKPETNSSCFITYSNIHKVALLGILGAIIGLGGYSQNKEKNTYPEFYEQLKDFKISIVPPKKNIRQKLNVFNNSTGWASAEDGGNFIVKENILLNPTWDIYILENGSIYFEKLKDYLLNQKVEFIPYLGRNDYPANITNVEFIELKECLDSSLIYDSLVVGNFDDIVEKELESLEDLENYEHKFLYFEKLPILLNDTFHYLYQDFLLTTDYVIKKDNSYFYKNFNLNFF